MHQRGSFHLILVADGTRATEAAVRATRELIDLAAVGRISVVAVGSPFAFMSDWSLGMIGLIGVLPQSVLDDLQEQAIEWATAETTRVIAQLGELKAEITAVARIGDAAETIVDFARETDAELIVIGSGEVSRQHPAMRGNLAVELTNRAPCPVMVVRELAKPRPRKGKRVHAPHWGGLHLAPLPVAAGSAA